MSIVLHDLIGSDDRRFSPYCWRTRMALAHKGLSFETRPTRFTEIAAIADGRQKIVPVIEDAGRIVADSMVIADYLEETYPDRPSLFGGSEGRALTGFVQSWVNAVFHACIIRVVMMDVFANITPEDKSYFRENREQRFGCRLEELAPDRDTALEALRNSLVPLRLSLSGQSFLGGDTPLYADYIVFGGFQWARTMSPTRLLADDDPLDAWLERLRDLYDGEGRSTLTFY